MKEAKRLDPMSIRLDPEVKAALEDEARAEDRSLSYVVNRVLKRYVETAKASKRGNAKS